MNEKEKQLLESFKLEELEKRFEMGRWIGSVKIGVETPKGSVNATFDTN